MIKLATTVLIAGASLGVAFADAPAPAATTKGAGTAQTIKQLEHDWSDALVAGDTDKLGQIVADDWVGIGSDGARETKQHLIEAVKSGKDKAESVEFGPMEVKVLGNVAVVQGSDTEKSSTNGKDTSGKWVWMDVFVKRDGNWVAVRSEAAAAK